TNAVPAEALPGEFLSPASVARGLKDSGDVLGGSKKTGEARGDRQRFFSLRAETNRHHQLIGDDLNSVWVRWNEEARISGF
ncbi:MAG: hypothetical protein ACI9KE_005373, partial [Polyangiales bacterium]